MTTIALILGASDEPDSSSSRSKLPSPRFTMLALPVQRKPLRTNTSRKLTSMRGLACRLRIVTGERISAKAIVVSSTTKNVPFGDRFGLPSAEAVAT